MKTGHDALCTTENESGRAKHENGTQLSRYCRKLFRAENEFEPPKHENSAQHHLYRRKGSERAKLVNGTQRLLSMPSVQPKTSPGEQNLKTGPDALSIAENDFGRKT
jgi:hypothetical protein